MEVVYYFDKDLGFSPVKKYLKQYIATNRDSTKDMEYKNYIHSSICAKIDCIAKEFDGMPIPGYAGPSKKYSFFKIKQPKNQNTVIRILYFCKNNKMILLNTFEKPAHYDKNRERKKEEKHYKKTDEYKNKFLNHKKYEEYEKYEEKKIN